MRYVSQHPSQALKTEYPIEPRSTVGIQPNDRGKDVTTLENVSQTIEELRQMSKGQWSEWLRDHTVRLVDPSQPLLAMFPRLSLNSEAPPFAVDVIVPPMAASNNEHQDRKGFARSLYRPHDLPHAIR